MSINTDRIHRLIIGTLERWLRDAEERYGLGLSMQEDSPARKPKGERDSRNPYLSYEADIKVKLGGYLEMQLQELNKKYEMDLTMHSELPLFERKSKSDERADLSVHNIIDREHWTTEKCFLSTCLAVIEIKYANYWKPEYGLEGDGHTVTHDLGKLANIEKPNDSILKVLLLVDEGCKIPPEIINKLKADAEHSNITFISNNRNHIS